MRETLIPSMSYSSRPVAAHRPRSTSVPRPQSGYEGAALLVKIVGVVMLGFITLGATGDAVVALFVATAYLTALAISVIVMGGASAHSERNFQPKSNFPTMHL